jgi:hypothetical protein
MTTTAPMLPLAVAARTALVTVETARAMLGVDADTVFALHESGELRWAWDIGATRSHAASKAGERREWRIWARSVQAYQRKEALTCQTIQSVVAEILPVRRERFPSGEAGQLLCCSRHHLSVLVRAGLLEHTFTGGGFFISRASLAQFLTQRSL